MIVATINRRVVDFDPAKRALTLAEHGLDMARAEEVFVGPTLTVADDRVDFGEDRFITVGRLDGRMIVFVWTPRGKCRHIISMRKANEQEQALYGQRLDGPG